MARFASATRCVTFDPPLSPVSLPADVLKELVLLSPHDFLHTLVPFLQHNHCTYHHSNIPSESPPPAPPPHSHMQTVLRPDESTLWCVCVCVLSVVRALPALQREHQADGSQEQHPAPAARTQHVSAALDGGEQ